MRLHFQSFGRGEPLVVLHGLFGSGDNWLTFAKHFSTRFRVVLLDARNHGLSPHAHEMTYAAMAADVHESMVKQGIGSAHVLGHSMGGKIAMEFALAYGTCVTRLVVVDIAPRAYDPHHDHIIEALCGVDLGRYRDRREIEEALADTIPELAVRRFLLKSMAQEPDGSFRWKLGLEEIRNNYHRLNEGLAGGRSWGGPSLFISGEKSDYIGDTDRALIREFFPAAEIRTVAGAGHWVHADAPGAFEAVVAAFVG